MTTTRELLEQLAQADFNTFGDPVEIAGAEPTLTPDEWVDIRDEIREHTFGDPALLPECLVEALKTLGEVGLQGDLLSRQKATQCLRRLAYRAHTGVPLHEPQEPAWSLDTKNIEDLPYERVLSDGDGDLG